MTKQELFDNIIKLIKLLKPKFYNKITWSVVIAGLAILSTSLIDKLINTAFEIGFEIEITDGNDALVGVVLVVIGLSYHVVSRKMEIQENAYVKKEQELNRSAHDTEVFKRIDKVIDEESLKDILDWIGTDHSYESEQFEILDNFYRDSRKHKNSYLYTEIEQKKQELISALEKLRGFLSLNFFVFPNDQSEVRRFCLYPDLNIDRCEGFPNPEKQQRYDEKAEEMFRLIDSTYDCYVSYRLSVKKWLFI